ncbi:MAG: sialate O-acetylesterase [Phycisphaerae bacterium]|nr:sialate O-acetylesterase [Phycisphaerae bacterium]
MHTLFLIAALGCIELPAVFSDHMVLQRDRPIMVWGRASPGAQVTVRFGDADPQECFASSDGSWRVMLPAEAAQQAPRSLRVTGDGSELVINDVLVGEVWLCGGQSNMEWTVNGSADPQSERARSAGRPTIRAIKVPHTLAGAPAFTTEAAWRICTPETVGDVTAVGWAMATDLQDALDGVPIGILDINWGGTRIEPWIDATTLGACPVTHDAVSQANDAAASDPAKEGERDQRFAGMYNAMIAPFVPYGIRGAVWYQGESNAGQAEAYRTLLPALVSSWRAAFGQPQMPFGVVQLAAFMKASDEPAQGGWAHLRDAQLEAAQCDPKVGLAITTDIGDADDIHPRNKREVGRRLALWALDAAYAKRSWPRAGPPITVSRAQSMVDGSLRRRLIVSFDDLGGPMRTRDHAQPDGFAIAGEDGRFVWAHATISGASVILWSPEVPDPVSVRYAWSDNPTRANLMDGRGMPIGPFRSDRPARDAACDAWLRQR